VYALEDATAADDAAATIGRDEGKQAEEDANATGVDD
jgi:hypothetical protein